MNITIVCDVLGKENNGTTITAMNLIRSMRARGHNVNVVCSDEEKRGMPGYYIVPTLNFGPLNGYIAKNGVALAKADRTILREAMRNADVVHIMLPYSLGAGAAKVAKELDIPYTAGCHALAENLTTHLFLQHSELANHLTYQAYYRLLYRDCACVHYVSPMMCELFESNTVPMPHCIVSNGVGKSFFPKSVEKPEQYRDRFVILYTGRYSREKSHKTLIDGVSRSKYRDQIQLIFAGGGPLEKELKQHAKKHLPIQPVFGFFSREEMTQLLNYADLYVHPALYEAEGIACLEAMACGNVILSSDSPKSATRFFALSPENLFHADDADSLAVKIDYWLEHPAEKERCGREYARYAAKFDFETCMNQMEKMLYAAAQQRQSDLLLGFDGRLCGDEYQDEGSGRELPVHS